MSRRAAFIDRDGTINVRPPEHEYITSVGDFAWLGGAAEGLARLARAGYVLAVVSNQRGVARGLVGRDVLSQIERQIQNQLAAHGCEITAFAYCLHDLSDDCDCRKPKPGLILGLAGELDLDLGRSWMIGDSASDVQAGLAAGCRTALISPTVVRSRADLVVASLAQAAEDIAGRESQRASAASASNASTSA